MRLAERLVVRAVRASIRALQEGPGARSRSEAGRRWYYGCEGGSR